MCFFFFPVAPSTGLVMAERGLSGEVGLGGGKRRISPVGSGVKSGAPRPSQARCSLLILPTTGRAWGSCRRGEARI